MPNKQAGQNDQEASQNFRFNQQGIPDKTFFTSSRINDPTKVIGNYVYQELSHSPRLL